MNESKKFGVEAWWQRYRKQLAALFNGDPDVTVGEVVKSDAEDLTYEITVEVRNDYEKYARMKERMETRKTGGNISLGIRVVNGENPDDVDEEVKAFEAIFRNNPNVRDVKIAEDLAGFRRGYVRFRPTVIQFHDDNLADYDRNWTGLAQNIANEVFRNDYRGMSFCTAPLDENVEEADENAD